LAHFPNDPALTGFEENMPKFSFFALRYALTNVPQNCNCTCQIHNLSVYFGKSRKITMSYSKFPTQKFQKMKTTLSKRAGPGSRVGVRLESDVLFDCLKRLEQTRFSKIRFGSVRSPFPFFFFSHQTDQPRHRRKPRRVVISPWLRSSQ
jgi:hypothetical protein